MGLFHPRNYDESPQTVFRKPKCEASNDKDYIKDGFFLIPIDLIEFIKSTSISPRKKPSMSFITYLLLLISRFNYHGSRGEAFSLSNSKIGRLLGMSPRNVQRAREKWAGWLTVQERRGESGPKDSGKTTEYLALRCPGLDSQGRAKAKSSYLEMFRSTFAFLLGAVGSGRIEHHHITAYLALRYLERADREDRSKPRSDFTIRKNELRALFRMDDTPKWIMELSQIAAPDRKPLFMAADKGQKLEITRLRDCPGPPCKGRQKSGDLWS